MRPTAQLSCSAVARAHQLPLFPHLVPPNLYLLQLLRDPLYGVCCVALPASSWRRDEGARGLGDTFSPMCC